MKFDITYRYEAADGPRGLNHPTVTLLSVACATAIEPLPPCNSTSKNADKSADKSADGAKE